MSVETSFESDRYFTRDEFVSWVEARAGTPDRFELLNGRIVRTPPSGWPQGEASGTVAALLWSFVRPAGLGRVFGADQGFELPSGDTVAPDAAFVSGDRWSATGPHAPGTFLRVAPDLVVEILSPATASRDRGEKKAIYERAGVREYWLVDLSAQRLTRFVLEETDRYGTPRTFERADTFESAVLPGLRFAVADLTG